MGNLTLGIAMFLNPFGYDWVVYGVNCLTHDYWMTMSVMYMMAGSFFIGFMYLYNKKSEPIDERIYYNEICDIYKDKYSLEYIIKTYDVAIFNKDNTINYKQMMYKNFCNGDCNTCPNEQYCF